jgi:hypothetical protein
MVDPPSVDHRVERTCEGPENGAESALRVRATVTEGRPRVKSARSLLLRRAARVEWDEV